MKENEFKHVICDDYVIDLSPIVPFEISPEIRVAKEELEQSDLKNQNLVKKIREKEEQLQQV